MSSYFIHVQEKKKVCIFLIKIYRKIQTELCMLLLSHSCLSTCLYFLISFTMRQYHVVAYSNALSLSFKSLYHWQNQFQASCAFLSSCLSICISMESLTEMPRFLMNINTFIFQTCQGLYGSLAGKRLWDPWARSIYCHGCKTLSSLIKRCTDSSSEITVLLFQLL